jgi:hypothetical protein
MSDPIAEALLTEETDPKGGRKFRVVELFGDQPEVLDAIRQLRLSGVSYRQLSKRVKKVTGHHVTPNAFMNWLDSQDIA